MTPSPTDSAPRLGFCNLNANPHEQFCGCIDWQEDTSHPETASSFGAPAVESEGTAPVTPILQCNHCGLLTFNLRRIGENHDCSDGANFLLHTVETLRPDDLSPENIKRSVLDNPLCHKVWTMAQIEMHARSDALRDAVREYIAAHMLVGSRPSAHAFEVRESAFNRLRGLAQEGT